MCNITNYRPLSYPFRSLATHGKNNPCLDCDEGWECSWTDITNDKKLEQQKQRFLVFTKLLYNSSMSFSNIILCFSALLMDIEYVDIMTGEIVLSI